MGDSADADLALVVSGFEHHQRRIFCHDSWVIQSIELRCDHLAGFDYSDYPFVAHLVESVEEVSP